MGSGLIWAGVGKGIADAGNSIGSAMMLEMRERNALEKAQALEDLREEKRIAREERDKKNRMQQATEATRLADEAGRTRLAEQSRLDAEAGVREEEQITSAVSKVTANNANAPIQKNAKGKTISQSPAASEDEIRALIKANPQANELYEQAGLINRTAMRKPEAEQSRMDPRLQRTQDEYDAAVGIGAHSSVLESFDKKRQRVLEEIRLENQAKREQSQRDIDNRREDRRAEEFRTLLPIRQQQVDAATTNANRPSGGGSGGGSDSKLNTALTQAENALTRSVDSATKRFREPTISEKTSAAGMEKYQREKNAAIDNDPDVKRQRARVEDLDRQVSGGAKTEKPKVVGPERKVGETRVIPSGPNKGKSAKWDGKGWLLVN